MILFVNITRRETVASWGGGSDEPIKNVNKLVKNLVTTGNTTVNDCHASRNTM